MNSANPTRVLEARLLRRFPVLLMLVLFLPVFMGCAQRGRLSLVDSDGDGFVDGPESIWKDGLIHWSEDRYGFQELKPSDMPGGKIQEYWTDPHNPKDRPPGPSTEKDTDGDGLPDDAEDTNGNGVFEPALGETNPHDADTDDDGLSDGFEVEPGGLVMRSAPLDPLNPDSDGDGLPDVLEAGIRSPAEGFPLLLRHIPGPPMHDTDREATFQYKRQTPKGVVVEQRKCFIADQDPSTITDPTAPDSNYDGVSDGLADVNSNGRRDKGEVDAAAGFVWDDESLAPERLYKEPITIGQPESGNPRDEGWAFYQPPQGEEATTGTFRVSDPDALEISRVERVLPRRNIWEVYFRWKRPEERVIEVWVESPAFLNGRTSSLKFRAVVPKKTPTSSWSGYVP